MVLHSTPIDLSRPAMISEELFEHAISKAPDPINLNGLMESFEQIVAVDSSIGILSSNISKPRFDATLIS